MIRVDCDMPHCDASAVVGWTPLLALHGAARVEVPLPAGWTVGPDPINGEDAFVCANHRHRSVPVDRFGAAAC